MKRIAVLILNYMSWIDTLVEVERLTEIIDVNEDEIIIVDNFSPNDSYQKLLENNNQRYTLLQSYENGGYGRGNNIGLRYAYTQGYAYAWILNNDIIIEDIEFLKKILVVFDKDSSLAVVNSNIASTNGHIFNRDSMRFSFMDMTFGFLQYREKGRILDDLGGYGYVYRPQGCCMITDLKKLHEVDYFEERTFLYSEEIILAEKLLVRGYRCACCTETSIVHNHSRTVKKNFDNCKLLKIQLESYEIYLKDYRSFGFFKRFLCHLFYIVKFCALNR